MPPLKGDSTAADVVGVLGESQNGDGVVGATGTSAKNGIFGRNDRTEAAPAGQPVGNGVFGLSMVPNASGVFGVNTNGGYGVAGDSSGGDGVVGSTGTSAKNGICGRNDRTEAAPAGQPVGNGVFGLSMVPNASGVFGVNNNGGYGVAGDSSQGDGVVGVTGTSAKNGIFGRNDRTDPAPAGEPVGNGVFGLSMVPNASGVFGINNNGGNGVAGSSSKGFGVAGFSESNNGVFGDSKTGFGLHGHSSKHIGVFGVSDSDTGVFGKGPKFAGFFEGEVKATGKVDAPDFCCAGADCAEEFDVDEPIVEPGTVMVIDGDDVLRACTAAYDKRVAGVVAGAGDYRPGLVLDHQASEPTTARVPISLIGKVFCKVDAGYGSIAVGDLLTTSPTPGHAMRADQPQNASGAMIGKALRAKPEGKGLIPILIALQ